MNPNLFKNKIILVTGGTGSIGSYIVEKLLQFGPKQVRVFSRDETKQLELLYRLKYNQKVSLLVGDIRDKERLDMAMENVDIVFHAAALKHVVSCEKNPFEAVKTNIQGTQNVIECAFKNNVERVVGVSTDKAAGPTNVMGCTKLLAERLMLSTYFYKGSKPTKFCYVRFGNVLASRGSVIPLFLQQIKRGGPVTLTDAKMTRFFMSIPQAVDLIFKATATMKDREIFILKMPSAKMGDLVETVLEICSEVNPGLKKISVNRIGRRAGERLHEKLLTEDEAENALETDDMFIIRPTVGFELGHKLAPATYKNARPTRKDEYTSDGQKCLSKQALKKLLLDIPEVSFKI